MKTRFGLVAAGLMVLAIVSTKPDAAFAAQPQKSDFTINTSEKFWDWELVEGKWNMSGVVSDSGPLTGLIHADYDRLWLEGEFGTMMIWLDKNPEPIPDTFTILEGTGMYEAWIGAVGVWDYKGNRGPGSSRKLYGFLP